MKLWIDMNLSPEWVQTFRAEGREAVHWSSIAIHAKDQEILESVLEDLPPEAPSREGGRRAEWARRSA